MTLANYVRDNFKGMLVFGDVHADYASLVKAHEYAVSNNLFFMSLGDLVDRGVLPFETISYMSRIVEAGQGGFTSGNHDANFYKIAMGEKHKLSADAKQTLVCVGADQHDEFLRMYAKLFSTPMFSDLYHIFDDITLVHAASHPSMWNSRAGHSNVQIARALYGETSGEKHTDGFPLRLYNWIDEIPMGKTVIVGHDRAPIYNILLNQPLIQSNSKGGKVFFMDTGCGKGGFLSGAVILHNKKQFKFDSFVDFKIDT